MSSDILQISADEIDLTAVYKALSNPKFGAQLVFVGVVRDENEGRRVSAVSYESFVATDSQSER